MGTNQGDIDNNSTPLGYRDGEMAPGPIGPCDFPPRGEATNVHRDISANTNESKGTPVMVPEATGPANILDGDCP